jgi:hypothetical protein
MEGFDVDDVAPRIGTFSVTDHHVVGELEMRRQTHSFGLTLTDGGVIRELEDDLAAGDAGDRFPELGRPSVLRLQIPGGIKRLLSHRP